MKTLPLLLQFEYERVVRPSDLGTATDTRRLAVAYHSFKVKSAGTGESLAHFDLAGQKPPGFYPLFGLSHPEPWGTWSDGTRTCVLIDVPMVPESEYTISVGYHIFGDAVIRAQVRANGRPAGEVAFSQQEVEFTLRREDSFDAIAAAASNNVSLCLSPAPALSIIIVNYNRPDLTTACILSVLGAQPNAPYEIVVVDNGSGSAEFLALMGADLPVQITRLDDRRSFGEANNLAAERARGAYILLLNNDVFLGASCIDALLASLGDSTVGAVGPILHDREGRLQEAGAAISMDGNVLLRDYSYFVDETKLPAVSFVDHISAACLMVRKDDFVGLGGFDPAYEPAYHEDVDLSCRLRATGKSVALLREPRTLHLRNATVNTLSASDSVVTAPGRSLLTFRSRWGAWLWSKDTLDVPAKLTVLPGDLKRQLDQFAEEPVNVILFAEPRGEFDLHSELAISSVLALSYPTLFCTRTSYSMLRLLHLTKEYPFPAQQVATASEQVLGARDIKAFVHSASEMPPAPRDYGERRILHCRTPIRAQRLTEAEMHARIEALSRLDALVTNSELARRKILGALNYIGGPALPVTVIRTPIIPGEGVELQAKQNLVVSSGPFRGGPLLGGHDVILRSFEKLRARFQYRKWQLVCIGGIHSQDDLRYYQDFSYRAAACQVRCLPVPTPRQKRDLFRRAKLCVSTHNWGVSAEDDEPMKFRFECAIEDALAHACVPVVYSKGAEAELCEYLHLKFTFDALDDIEEQISLAASFSESEDLSAHWRRWMEALSVKEFRERWQSLLSAETAVQSAALFSGGAHRQDRRAGQAGMNSAV
jgi:GT2 family glycosyltransferase